VPSLLLDGLLRVHVLDRDTEGWLPLAAPTAVARVNLYERGNDLALSSVHGDLDLYAVGDVMDDKGWNLNRNTDPRGLHLMLSPAHGAVVDELIADLRDAVADHGDSRGVEARYS
jgi:hypothetical protein